MLNHASLAQDTNYLNNRLEAPITKYFLARHFPEFALSIGYWFFARGYLERDCSLVLSTSYFHSGFYFLLSGEVRLVHGENKTI